MRKSIFLVPVLVFSLTACVTPKEPTSSGKGTITEMEHEPFKCLKRVGAKCTKSKAEEWEIDYLDSISGQEAEAKVSKTVYNTCRVGAYFKGKYAGC